MFEDKKIILFDGHCVLCSRSLQFIIKRDKKSVFLFIPFQSKTGQLVKNKLNINSDLPNSLILIDNKKVYNKSDAVLRITRYLKGLWPLCYVFTLIPKQPRDYIYSIISKNRYKWFGRIDYCKVNYTNNKNKMVNSFEFPHFLYI